MAIILPARARQFVQLTADDTVLQQKIADADEAIAIFLGWPATETGARTLESADYVLRLTADDGDDVRRLYHGHPWVTAVTEARTDDDHAFGADTDVALADLDVDNEGRSVWLLPTSSSSWATGRRSCRLSFTGGYTDGVDLPLTLGRAVAHMAKSLLDGIRTGGASQINQGGVSTTLRDLAHDVPTAVQAMLYPWVNWRSRAS